MNIRCAKCKGRHESAAQVRACHLVTAVADLMQWPAELVVWAPQGHPNRAAYVAEMERQHGDNAAEAILAADETAEDWQWFAEVAAERADAVAVA